MVKIEKESVGTKVSKKESIFNLGAPQICRFLLALPSFSLLFWALESGIKAIKRVPFQREKITSEKKNDIVGYFFTQFGRNP